MGREDQLKAEQKLKLRQQFAQALRAGTSHVRDRFSNALEIGTQVLWHPPYDLVYEVVSISPMLDLNAPPGLARVVLVPMGGQVELVLPADQVNVGMVALGKVEHAAAAGPSGDPPADPPPHEPPTDPPPPIPFPGVPPAPEEPIT